MFDTIRGRDPRNRLGSVHYHHRGITMNRRFAVAVTVLLAAGSLTGCGGGGTKVDTSSASAIAAAMDKGGFTCTGWKANPAAVGPKESGSCDHGGTAITVSTFESADQMKRVVDSISKAFGQDPAASGTGAVIGDAWMVTPGDASQGAAIQKIIGGTVK